MARLGSGWIRDLEKVRRLEPMAEDRELHFEWRAIKLQNKTAARAYIQERLGIAIDPGVDVRCAGEAAA
jgi:starch phosphorylase